MMHNFSVSSYTYMYMNSVEIHKSQRKTQNLQKDNRISSVYTVVYYFIFQSVPSGKGS